MKTAISVIVGLAIFFLGFWLDGKLIDYIISQLPKSGSDWFGVIRIILWIFTFSFTFAISLTFAVIAGKGLHLGLESIGKNKVNRKYGKHF